MITPPESTVHALVEICPICGATDVRATEPHWFALEFDRGQEVRTGVADGLIEFSCRECGSAWR